MRATTDFESVCFRTWRPDHNNARYASLFPYIAPIVKFYGFNFSSHRLVHALQARIWSLVHKQLIYPIVLGKLEQKYQNLYTIDFNQIPFWRGRVVIDIDDPEFTPNEIRCLNHRNVAGVIVTTKKAKAILEEHGVENKIYIIPQGVTRTLIDPQRVEEIRTHYKKQDLVVGHHSPRLTLSADGARRAKQGLNDLDILVNAVETARNVEPRLTLWLVGHASEELKRLADRVPWIRLFGYIPIQDLLNYVENFDIGTYTRTTQVPLGRFSIKLAQYMVCSVPIVSTNVDESFIVNEAKCGIVADSPDTFTQVLIDLVQSDLLRSELGQAGKRYASTELDWDILIPRYKQILEDNFS